MYQFALLPLSQFKCKRKKITTEERIDKINITKAIKKNLGLRSLCKRHKR